MQKKVYEDYEPISNIGVCSALLIVLSSATYLGVFSTTKEKTEKQPVESVKVIQKDEKANTLMNTYFEKQKERIKE